MQFRRFVELATGLALLLGSVPALRADLTVNLTAPSGSTTVALGTAVTLTSTASDPSGTITQHNLDIERPDPDGQWNYDQASNWANGLPFQGGGPSDGQGYNSTCTGTFVFDQVGVWTVRGFARNSVTFADSGSVTVTVTGPSLATCVVAAGNGTSVTGVGGGTTAPTLSIPRNGSVTFTTTTGDQDGALTNQAIDYLPPGATDWSGSSVVSGTVTDGSRWEGGPAPRNTLVKTYSNLGVGNWQFRVRGQNSGGALSDFQYITVNVLDTPPSGSVDKINGVWFAQTAPGTPLGTVLAGSTVQLQGWAYDDDTGLTGLSVQVLVNGTLQGTAVFDGWRGSSDPNGWTYNLSTAGWAAGDYQVTVQAVDPQGVGTLLSHNFQGDTTGSNTLTLTLQPNNPPTESFSATVGTDQAAGVPEGGSVPTIAVATSGTITFVGAAADPDKNLTSQAIDYLPPGGTAWVSGDASDGTRWDGTASPNNNLTRSFTNMTEGQWQFRAQSGDALSAHSGYYYINVNVVPNHPPYGYLDLFNGIWLTNTAAGTPLDAKLGSIVQLRGWVNDYDTGATGLAVNVLVDGTQRGTGVFDGWRTDGLTGWTCNLNTTGLSVGPHQVTVQAVDPQGAVGTLEYNFQEQSSATSLAVNITTGTVVNGAYVIHGVTYPSDGTIVTEDQTAQSVPIEAGADPSLIGSPTDYQASAVTVPSGGNVAFVVAETKAIYLEPGFSAKKGGKFHAYLAGHSSIAVGGTSSGGGTGGSGGTGPLADADVDGLTNIAEGNLGTSTTSYDKSASEASSGTLPSGWPTGMDTRLTDLGDEVPGAFAGSLSVDKSGGANYSIPIWVVPGTAGMQPQLALTYSSQGGPGALGFGWSLSGLSAITRGGQTRAVDGQNVGMNFSSTDRYYFDGQRLIAISGSDGGDGTEYRTESESFSRIRSYGTSGSGPSYFKVWTKAGLIMEFGHTDDSALKPSTRAPAGNGEVMTWAVNRITDSVGNYMTFTYTKDDVSGEQIISEIDYTMTANRSNAYASVEFDSDTARPDTAFGYSGGALLSRTRRINTIRACYNGSTVRSYVLNYSTRPTNNRSMLTKVYAQAANGQILPPLTFDYEQSTASWEQHTDGSWLPPTPTMTAQGYKLLGPTQYGTGYIDLDGDGRPDFVQNYWDVNSSTATVHAWLNKPAGWQSAEDPSTIDFRPPFWLGSSNNADTGARFVDLNGDGLVDMIWSHQDGNGNVSSGASLNTGHGWVSAPGFTPLQPLAVDKQNDKGARFVDLNGDGRVDLIMNGAAYLNTGSGWTLAPGYQATGIDLGKGVTLVDINGDGLPDLVQSWYGNNTLAQSYYLNTGSGWGPRQSLPSGFPLTNAGDSGTWGTNSPIGSEFVDINGDGLVDVIARNDASGNQIAPQVWFNTGTGFVLDTTHRYDPPFELYHDHESQGVSFSDVNGDGLVDMVKTLSGSPTQVCYNTGSGWTAPVTADPAAMPASTYVTGWVNQDRTNLVDIDGDGVPDQVGSWVDNGITTSVAYRSLINPNQDRLQKVTTGLGVAATISYKPLTDSTVYTRPQDEDPNYTRQGFPTADVMGAMYVVSEVNYDETGGTTYPVDYHYSGLRSHAVRGSLGFAWMSVTDGRTNVETKTWFNQPLNLPTTRPTTAFSATDADWQAWAGFATIGLPTTVKTYAHNADGTTTTLSSATSQYAVDLRDNGWVVFPHASTSVQTSYDLNGAFVSSSGTTSTYDDSGNATEVDVVSLDASGNSDGFTKSTVNTYYPDDTAGDDWVLGRLETATVTATRPAATNLTAADTTMTRKSKFVYYGTGDGVLNGLLKQEIVEPDQADTSTLKLTTTYAYDSFGNKQTVTVSGYGLGDDPTMQTVTVAGASVQRPFSTNANTVGTRKTTTVYDTNGRFPDHTTNALNQTETYLYDQSLGVPTRLTGPNQLPTNWDYDAFGRKTTETRADGTHSYVHYRWITANSPDSTIQYFVETQSDGAAPALTCYDGFGRDRFAYVVNGGSRIATAGQPAGPRTVIVRKDYDTSGRVYQASLPYYYGDTPKVASRTLTFDALGRPESVATVDEAVAGGAVNMDVANTTLASGSYSSTTFVYNGLTTSATVQRRGGANDCDITTTTTKNSQGWVVSVVTNSTAALSSPDRGETDYIHDAYGQLRFTQVRKDANTWATTEVQYDLVGRKSAMVDPDMGTWSYAYNAGGELTWQKDAKGQEVTMAYDQLGRLFRRVEAEGATTWVYDTAARGSDTWIGSVGQVYYDSGTPYSESYAYDAYGRPSSLTRTINDASLPAGMQTFTSGQTYDSYGRADKTVFPGGYAVQARYDAFGFLCEIRDARQSATSFLDDTPLGMLYWEADSYSVWGGLQESTLGNGLTWDKGVSVLTGRTTSVSSFALAGPLSSGFVDGHTYTYDTLGNVYTRTDSVTNRQETFQYDGLNRLTSTAIAGGSTVTVNYDPLGNITSKSDVGTYKYQEYGAGPHAVSSAGGQAYYYDANGNLTSGGGRSVQWTSFNQASRIDGANNAWSTFAFGAAHERVIQKTSAGVTTVYIGSGFEATFVNGQLQERRHYIMTPIGRTAVRVEGGGNTGGSSLVRTRWFHQDGLGSVTAVSDEWGRVETRYSYDSWGKQTTNVLRPDGSGLSGPSSTGGTTGAWTNPRGYTDHEMLTDLGLIHMNGRIYDPVLGRFLSADPNIDGAYNSQGFNRYSYVGNNPVNHIDPTGYHKNSGLLSSVIGIVVTVIVAIYAPELLPALFGSGGLFGGFGAAVVAGAAGGFASGFSGSLLNGSSLGAAFKAGAIGAAWGAASAAVAYGIGQEFDSLEGGTKAGAGDPWVHPYGEAGRALAHGVADGAMSEAQGGNFRSGFYAGAFSSAASSVMGHYHYFDGTNKDLVHSSERTAVAAVVGGTTSVIGGGKFANGAMTAAFDHLFNAEVENIAKRAAPTVKSYNDIVASIDSQVATGKAVTISPQDMLVILDHDAWRAADIYSPGWNGAFGFIAVPVMAGDDGDGTFRRWGGATFIVNGVRSTAGEINYYFQGMASAASGWNSVDYGLIKTWNYAPPRFRFHDQQIQIREYWAERGYEYFKHHIPKSDGK